MFLSCIAERTAIIFLYRINRLVFITEAEYVYCAVRTGSLNIIQVNYVFKGINIIYLPSEKGTSRIKNSSQVNRWSKTAPPAGTAQKIRSKLRGLILILAPIVP